jgi:pimeloyl-ACP methyl ester carboxylesterase
MQLLSRTRLPYAAVLGLTGWALLGAAAARAAENKAEFKRVPFVTADGVELEGTYYPKPGGKQDAVVLLLHNFDMRKGGDSHQDGWDRLAESLQAADYAVFAFDFRGFGNSKKLENPMKFWSTRHNQVLKGASAAKLPDTIDHKKFPPYYSATLINDIVAAKAFLDRKNDAGELNASNLIVIGAGEGATLGAIWVGMQCHLQRNRAPVGFPLALDEHEGKDIAAGVWLSISPVLGGRNVTLGVRQALLEAGRENKIPMAFVYGAKDAPATRIAKSHLEALRNGKKVDLPLTGEQAVKETDLSGSKLLADTLPTEGWIVKQYLFSVMEKRGSRERRKRESDKHGFVWAFPRPGPAASTVPAKLPGEEVMAVVPIERFGLGGVP